MDSVKFEPVFKIVAVTFACGVMGAFTGEVTGAVAMIVIGLAIYGYFEFRRKFSAVQAQAEDRLLKEFSRRGGKANSAFFCCNREVLIGFCDRPDSILIMHRRGHYRHLSGSDILRVELIPDIRTRVSAKSSGTFFSVGGFGLGGGNTTVTVHDHLKAVWVEVLTNDLGVPRIMFFFSGMESAQVWSDRLEVLKSRHSKLAE